MSFHPQTCSTVHMTRSRKTQYQLHGHILQKEIQVKYLGLTLTKDLKWGPHIMNISNKANKTLGFMRRNVKVNCKAIKEAAYKALVRSTLEYGSVVWDPHTAKDVNTVEKVQRRAARWVCHRFRQSSSVGDMLQELSWDTLQTRRKRARLCTFYKFHHGMVTINSKNLPTLSQPKRQTRQSHPFYYNIPLGRTQYRQMSFFPRTVSEWNLLPAEIVTAPSLESFRDKVANLH